MCVTITSFSQPVFSQQTILADSIRAFRLGEVTVLGRHVQTGAQYSYIRRQNLSNPDLRFVYTPDNKSLAYAEAQIRRRLTVVGSTEYNSARFSTSYGTEADAFLVANVKASVRLQWYESLEGGVNNIFDRNYALAEGFPEPGRNFFVNIVLTNL